MNQNYLRVSDHAVQLLVNLLGSNLEDILHYGDTSSMKLVNGPFWRNTNSADEQSSFISYDDINKLWQLTTRVIFLQVEFN